MRARCGAPLRGGAEHRADGRLEPASQDLIRFPRRAKCLADNWHSHTTTTFHPKARRAVVLRRSRSTLAANLLDQNWLLLDGVDANLQPTCRCQKQPWTNTTVLHLASTTSGRPGRSRRWRLYLNPIRCRKRRTVRSGPVSRLRIVAMIALRVLASTKSVILLS